MSLAVELTAGGSLTPAGVSALIAAAGDADPKTRPKLQSAALLAAALSPDLPAADRVRLAAFAVPEGKGPAGRDLALAYAAEHKLMGETALVALWIAAEGGAAGPALGDRVRIVRALDMAGLPAEARAFAIEGLLGLK